MQLVLAGNLRKIDMQFSGKEKLPRDNWESKSGYELLLATNLDKSEHFPMTVCGISLTSAAHLSTQTNP